jgi:uncharacterized paraquat-inducible protein A
MALRTTVCVAVFVIAYILLIPGLTMHLFSAKAVMLGQTVIDLEKSTLGALRMLFEKERYGAAVTILVCSVIAPFAKLAVMVVAAFVQRSYDGKSQYVSPAITAVRRVSKWATVDAFTAASLVALFSNVTMPLGSIDVQLHEGFYCFIGYCIFSVAGALLLEKPEQDSDEEEQVPMLSLGTSFRHLVAPAFAGGCLVVAMCLAWKCPLIRPWQLRR